MNARHGTRSRLDHTRDDRSIERMGVEEG